MNWRFADGPRWPFGRLAGHAVLGATAAFVFVVCLGSAAAAPARSELAAIPVGGSPLALVAARGSLWVLTCDRRCSGEARRSVGRLVRIDPRRARVLASATVERPGALAVGAEGVFLTDFGRHAVRRLDAATLRPTRSLKLVLPFRVPDNKSAAFLPNDVAVGADSVWVSTEWCALSRLDARLHRAVASVRLPCDAYQTMAFGEGALWISESLAGTYRIDPATNRVTARIQIGPRTGRLVPIRFLFARGIVLAIGARTRGGALTGSNGLARLDPSRNQVESVTPLPSGQLAVAGGGGALWVAHVRGATVARIDPRTGRTASRIHGRVGIALALAAGRLWTADQDGAIRPL
jgi:streptogramin lyase